VLVKDEYKKYFLVLKAQNGFGRAQMGKNIDLLNSLVDSAKLGELQAMDVILYLLKDKSIADKLLSKTDLMATLMYRVNTSGDRNEKHFIAHIFASLANSHSEVVLPLIGNLFVLLDGCDNRTNVQVAKIIENILSRQRDLVKSDPKIKRVIEENLPKLPQPLIGNLKLALETTSDPFEGREAADEIFLITNNVGVTIAAGFLWSFSRYTLQSMKLRMVKLPIGRIIQSSGKATLLLGAFEILRQGMKKVERDLTKSGKSWESEALNITHSVLMFPLMVWSLNRVSFVLFPYFFGPHLHVLFKKSVDSLVMVKSSK
jgi:hypothetical protein